MENKELRIGGLQEGVVIDHIRAGGAMEIYNYLHLFLEVPKTIPLLM